MREVLLIISVLVFMGCAKKHPEVHFELHETLRNETNELAKANNIWVTKMNEKLDEAGRPKKGLETIQKAKDLLDSHYSYIYRAKDIQDSLMADISSIEGLFENNEKLVDEILQLKNEVTDRGIVQTSSVELTARASIMATILQLDHLILCIEQRTAQGLHLLYNSLTPQRSAPVFLVESETEVMQEGDDFQFTIKVIEPLEIPEASRLFIDQKPFTAIASKDRWEANITTNDFKTGENNISGRVEVNVIDTVINIPFESVIEVKDTCIAQ